MPCNFIFMPPFYALTMLFLWMDENPEAEYKAAEEYWKTVSPDVNGMLGGLENVSDMDVTESRKFLAKVLNLRTSYALDCGCGIGRVTKHVLAPVFDRVDLVDVSDHFLQASLNFLGPECNDKVGERFCCGLQDFVPPMQRYNVVWVQWVSGHLTDDHFKLFLRRCTTALAASGGAIVLKDNVAPARSHPLYDSVDHSVTRPTAHLHRLFSECGLAVAFEEKQKRFPKRLLQVSSEDSDASTVHQFCGFNFRLERCSEAETVEVSITANAMDNCEAYDLLINYSMLVTVGDATWALTVDSDLVYGGQQAAWRSAKISVPLESVHKSEECQISVDLSVIEVLTVYRENVAEESERDNFMLMAGSDVFYVDLAYLAGLGSPMFEDMLDRSRRGLRRLVVLAATADDLRIFLTALCRYGRPMVTYHNWPVVVQLAGHFQVRRVLYLCETYLLNARGLHAVRKLEYGIRFRLENLVRGVSRQLAAWADRPGRLLEVLHDYLQTTGEQPDQLHPDVLAIFGITSDMVIL